MECLYGIRSSELIIICLYDIRSCLPLFKSLILQIYSNMMDEDDVTEKNLNTWKVCEKVTALLRFKSSTAKLSVGFFYVKRKM